MQSGPKVPLLYMLAKENREACLSEPCTERHKMNSQLRTEDGQQQWWLLLGA